jgi:hypothetical protein
MHAPPLQAKPKAPTGMLIGPENVDDIGVVQSTWKRQRLSVLLVVSLMLRR